MNIQTARDLAAAARRAATDYKTLYVNGCFGAPMTDRNKARYISGYEYNQRDYRRPKIEAASPDTFGFDCICFVKGLLWGWSGDPNSIYGGADYAVNGVPDITEESMLNVCSGISDRFDALAVGEYLWAPGHCGIYLGSGLAVEATPDFADGVQLTAVENMGSIPGYPGRTWQKHGKLPYVTYEAEVEAPMPATQVQALQALLILRGFSCGKGFIDGQLGADTQKAVADFCKDTATEPMSDTMWKALLGK